MKSATFLFIAANEGNSWGGSEFLWSSTAEKLVRSGNQVRISVKDWGRPIPQVERLRSAGCQIFYRRVPPPFSRLIHKVIAHGGYDSEHVGSIGRGVDLAVVSQGANIDGLPWMEAAGANGLRYVVVSNGAAEYWWPEDNTAERLAKSYENAICAYFVSQGNTDLSRHQFGTPLRNATIVRNPFNVRYDANPAWPSDPEEELRLACVARLDTGHKGQDILLRVLALERWCGRNVRVSLVGEGLHERGLRRMAEALQVRNVDFLGQRDNIEEVWSRHHAFVLASRYEGMPLALVEAMLCRRACIVTDVASNRELVRDGVTGFLAKAPTLELVDEAMNRAWENRHRLQQMGTAAGEEVRKWVSADPAEDFARELQSVVDREVNKTTS